MRHSLIYGPAIHLRSKQDSIEALRINTGALTSPGSPCSSRETNSKRGCESSEPVHLPLPQARVRVSQEIMAIRLLLSYLSGPPTSHLQAPLPAAFSLCDSEVVGATTVKKSLSRYFLCRLLE